MNPKQALIAAGMSYAEVCAECEALRIAEPFDRAAWSAAWERRMPLLNAVLRAARSLTSKPTGPT